MYIDFSKVAKTLKVFGTNSGTTIFSKYHILQVMAMDLLSTFLVVGDRTIEMKHKKG